MVSVKFAPISNARIRQNLGTIISGIRNRQQFTYKFGRHGGITPQKSSYHEYVPAPPKYTCAWKSVCPRKKSKVECFVLPQEDKQNRSKWSRRAKESSH